ncbi:response regulator [Hydrocarboniphaga sp.]|uniref:response regulator n=1 Tax=Hydrocarboniphaga sp. TaxID=2033016 RepID=UPI003D143344
MGMDEYGFDTRLRVLCVDDEPAVLEGLELSLRRHYEVDTAASGEQALQLMRNGDYAVLLSDMRMPGINGAALLATARKYFPDTVRVLLTGYADVSAAASAINDGHIFRFLIKPCPPPVVQRAIADAVAQHRLQTVERSLLERTLRGAVQALTEVLSLTDPDAFARATQVQKLSLAMASKLDLQPTWALELAAMLAPLGRVSLPPELMQREASGEALRHEADREALSRVAEVTQRLLAPIPRLEPVRDILREAERESGARALFNNPSAVPVARLARVLKLASRFVDQQARGDSVTIAIGDLRANYGDRDLIEAIEAIKGAQSEELEVRTVPIRLLRAGMTLCDDLLTQSGQRLVPRGYEVNASLVERIRNLRTDALRGPVRVVVQREATA